MKNGWHGPDFNELIESRRGATGNQLQSNGSTPTFWGNPFRATDAAELTTTGLQRKAVNVGLLRARGANPDGVATENPLFGHEPGETHEDYGDPARHRIMALQPIERLANLTTTRSNVYAMWVTVGYFEVTPNNSVPGGYQNRPRTGDRHRRGRAASRVRDHRSLDPGRLPTRVESQRRSSVHHQEDVGIARRSPPPRFPRAARSDRSRGSFRF
ncbi:MAG: hypothetical protein QM811_12770 [Pirellulales bacterium]